MAKKETSIRIDESTWKRAKKKCIDDEISISEYLENLIKIDLTKKTQ